MRSEVEVKYVTEQYLSKANTYMAIGTFLLFIPFYFIENWILIPFVILICIGAYFLINIYYSGSLLFVKNQSGVFVTRRLSKEKRQSLGQLVEVKKTWNYNFNVSEYVGYDEYSSPSGSLQVNLELHFKNGHSIIIVDDLYPWQEDVNDFEYRHGDRSMFKEESYARGSLRKILRSAPWLFSA